MNNRLPVWAIESACGALAITSLILLFAPVATGQSTQPSLANQGKSLIAEMKCIKCHSIAGRGGCLSPPLDGVSARHSRNYLTLRLSSAPGDEDRFIKILGHPELFPHPRFPRKQVDALVAYLVTLPKLKSVDSRSRGAILYHANECQACHSIGGVGAKSGLPLDDLPASHGKDFIVQHLLDPEQHVRQNAKSFGGDENLMPTPNLSEEESSAIADYILSMQKPSK